MKDTDDENQSPLRDSVDVGQWEAQFPPDDFAARVFDRIRAEAPVQERAPARAPKRRARRWAAATAGVGAIAIAAAVLLRMTAPPSTGEAIAKDRVTVPIGTRALAVLEPGANVRWNGDDVVQLDGDVFYRVEPGARFTVHTPAGDVEVKGTCFTVKVRPVGESRAEVTDMQRRDFKAGAIGAGLSALAFVAVFEGKVALSHATQRVDLGAGQTAQSGPDGVSLTGAAADGAKAFEQNVAAARADDDPMVHANQNLVRQVGEYRSRLDAVTKQKADLEQKLQRSEASLAASQDGAPVAFKHEYDLSQDDWKEMAEKGMVKYRVPCISGGKSGPWSPSPEKLNVLGLAPQDGTALKDAYARSSKRLTDLVNPLCAKVVGNPDIVAKLGPETCVHLVLDEEGSHASSGKPMQEIAEIRAGLRPMPGPNDPTSPALKVLLALTGASKAFEADLAQSFGPEEAHRLAYSDELCMSNSTFRNGPPPKK